MGKIGENFGVDGHMSLEQMNLRQNTNNKVRIVLRVDIVKTIQGFMQYSLNKDLQHLK